MSDWDKKADEGAIKHYSDWCPEGTLESHRRGAKWQRDELRTGEAIERVARAICRRNWPKNEDFKYYWMRYGDDFRADARSATDALLGEGT